MHITSDTSTGKVLTIAIHGVGTHELGSIQRRIEETLKYGNTLDLKVREYNWDQYVEHSRWKGPKNFYWSLQKTSFNIQAAARVGIARKCGGIDSKIASIQLLICELLRYLFAFLFTLAAAIPAITIIVFLPSAFEQINSALITEEIIWLFIYIGYWFMQILICGLAVIVIMSVLRSIIQKSTIPIIASLVFAFFTLFNPLLLIISIPIFVNWIAVCVIVIFFGVFGVFISLISLIPTSSPVYSMWGGFVIGRYLIIILGGVVILQILSSLMNHFWQEYPLKIILDIIRYLGECDYRTKILEELDQLIEREIEANNQIVFLAHSLGSVIAIDYLLNYQCIENKYRRILLITMGSPFRRFFIRFFPGVIFYPRINDTAITIQNRFQEFKWLNVYRPWDYIGASLNLEKNVAGIDKSTEQYNRFGFNSHSGYWEDQCVLNTINQAIYKLYTPKQIMPINSFNYLPNKVIITQPSINWIKIPFVVSCFLVLLSFLWMGYSIYSLNIEMEQQRIEIDAKVREPIQVFVSHQEILDVASSDEQRLTAHRFIFFAENFKMPPIDISPYLPFSKDQHRFDYRKLKQFIYSNCELKNSKKWLGIEFGMPECISRETIKFKYLPPSEKKIFYLPDFKSKLYLRDLPGWILHKLVMFIFLVSLGEPFILLASAVFFILLGQDVEKLGTDKLSILGWGSDYSSGVSK